MNAPMARTPKHKKRSKDDSEIDTAERRVSSEALRGVGAVFSIALAGFLILADFGVGGKLGAVIFSALSYLLGIGYLLLPVSLILLSIAVLRSFEKHFGLVQLFSMTIFLLSGLGLINVAFPTQAGLLGRLVSTPLLHAVDTAATVIFLLSFIVATLIISFDAHLGLLISRLFSFFTAPTPEPVFDSKNDVAHATISAPLADTEHMQPETPEMEEKETEPKPRKEKISVPAEDAPTEGFPIIASTGSAYEAPPIALLSKNKGKPEVGDVKANMNIIKRTLQNFGIAVEMDEVSIGPSVTRYALKPAEGVKLSRILGLQNNLELALAAHPVRIEAPIPGKSLVGIEIPNTTITTVGLGSILSESEFQNSEKPLLVALGKDISGAAHFANAAKMPHLLLHLVHE